MSVTESTPVQDKVTIYAMAHPDKPALIRYVGKTKHGLKKRLRGHINFANRKNTPKNAWVASIVKKGKVPAIWPLELCSEKDWEERERFWIKLFGPLPGFLNLTDGGDCPPSRAGIKLTPEQIRHNTQRRKEEDAKKARTWLFGNPVKSRLQLILFSGTQYGRTKRPSPLLGIPRPKEVIERIKKANIINSVFRKPVQCVDTGEIFLSIKQAEKHVGISYRGGHLSRAIKTNCKFFGMKWRFV